MDKKLVCEKNQCTGCMACVAVCPKYAITIEDSLIAYNAVIDESLCVECKLCEEVCQNHYAVIKQKPFVWYEGWAKDPDIRSMASSGGIATAIAIGFVRNGGYVCSCIFDKGRFTFQLTNREEDLWKSMGSKYVKSDPEGVYLLVRDALKSGERVLFIGLPCQVAGMKRFVGDTLQERLYTIDLICHGTPSPKVLDIFLQQYGTSLSEIESIKFRIKEKYHLVIDEKNIERQGVSDCYSISFIQGINLTDNCYKCVYAQRSRVSDITLGDSWGNDREMHAKGISLILCQTQKGQELLDKSDIQLHFADMGKAIENNKQLIHSSCCPSMRNTYFNGLISGERYNKLVWKIYFKHCLKQFVKKCLIWMRLIS